jgi:hypothetical protein
MSRHFRRFIEFIAALVAVGVVIFLGVFWRLAAHPLAPTDLTLYAHRAVERFLPDGALTFTQAIVGWDNQTLALSLTTRDVAGHDAKRGIDWTAPSVVVQLKPFDLLRGRLIPLEVQAAHVRATVHAATPRAPRSALQRFAAHEIALGLLDELTNKNLRHALQLDDLAVQLEGPEADRALTLRWPRLWLAHNQHDLRVEAALDVLEKGQVAANVTLNATYDAARKQHTLAVTLNRLDPALLLRLRPDLLPDTKVDLPVTGAAQATFGKTLDLLAFDAKLSVEQGLVNAPALWDAPRSLRHLQLDAHYDRPNNRIDVKDLSVDFNGTKLALTLDAKPPLGNVPAGAKDMAFVLNLQLDRLPMDAYTAVWPKGVVPNVRVWVAENMSKGVFSKGVLTLNGRFNWNAMSDPDLDSGSGKISAKDARVRYLHGMPPLEGVSADATFDLDHMDVAVTGGGIGAIRLLPTTLKLTDFQKNVQYIDIPAKLTGSVHDVLALMDQPPLGYAKAVGLKPDESEGRVDGTLFLRFPLLNDLAMKDVEVRATANLVDLALPKLVPGLDIAEGNMALTVDKKGYALKGPALLKRVPLQISWQGFFGASSSVMAQATVSGALDQATLAKIAPTLTEAVKGTIPLTVHYTEPRKGAVQLAVELNLKNAALNVPQIVWSKAAGVPATLTVAAELPKSKPVVVRQIDLTGTGVRVHGSARLAASTFDLLSLDLKPAQIGRTNAALHFEQTGGPTGTMEIVADGEALDVSGLDTSGDPKAEKDRREKNVHFRLGRLITAPNGEMTSLVGRARRDGDGWQEIDFHGLADNHPVDIKLVPRGGKKSFQVACDDFGAMLKGIGLTDTLHGGSVDIRGESTVEHPNRIDGKIKIGAFTVSGLPILVRLVSAVSPLGIADLLTGDTSFDKLQGRFRWSADELEFIKIQMAGTSYGLNIGGRLRLADNVADLNGTLVPFSFMNSLIGAIPMIGDVITGGDGQGVIAASYAVRGKLSDAQISVNPVSLLTPGFLRNLFFGTNEAAADSDVSPEQPKKEDGEKE